MRGSLKYTATHGAMKNSRAIAASPVMACQVTVKRTSSSLRVWFCTRPQEKPKSARKLLNVMTSKPIANKP